MKKIYTFIFAVAIIAMLTYGFNFSPENNANNQSVVFLNNNFTPISLNSQSPMATTLISATGDGGFETGTTFAANGWTSSNSANNPWVSGTYVSTPPFTNRSAYISNDAGVTNNYTNTASSLNYFYRDITVPAGESLIQLSFNWVANGESTWDLFQVFTAPTSVTPTGTTTHPGSGTSNVPTGISGATFITYGNLQTTIQTTTVYLPASLAGTTFRLIFAWKNDGSGGVNPGGSIDNISLISQAPVPMSGVYTIDNTLPTSGTNFASFTAAINNINGNGISGAVTFNVTAGQTFTEEVPAITATGTVSNTITFQKSGAGANPIIRPTGTVATNDAGIKIAGGDYITFDGIDITIASGSAVEFGYYIYNASATNGAQYNTIKNSKTTLNRTNTTSRGIYQYTATTPTNQGTGNNNYNKYYNITVENSYVGIYLQAASSTYFDVGCEIGTESSGSTTIGASTANDIGNSTTAVYGIRAAYQSGVKIFNTTIRNLNSTSNSARISGIFLENSYGTSAIYNNKIGPVTSSSTTVSNTTNYVVTGMRLDVASGATVNVYNNFIFGISQTPTAATTAAPATYTQIAGIVMGITAGTTNLYYNSIRIETNANIHSACVMSTGSTANTMTFKNNIFSNNTVAQTGTPKHYGIMRQGSNGTLTGLDYNDYYIQNTGNGYVGYYTADRALITDWRTATTQDASSKSVNPSFTSATDLHIPDATVTELESAGTPISGITTDIDGTTRNASTPDIGADEFAGVGLDLTAPTISYTALTNTTSTSARTLTSTITDFSGVPTSGLGLPVLYWRINAGAYTAATATFISGSTYEFTFGTGVVTGDVVSYFVAAQDNAGTPNVGGYPAGGSGYTANPPAAGTPTATPSTYTILSAPLSGDYTVGVLMFNKVTGKNITFEKVITKVIKDLPVYEEEIKGKEFTNKIIGTKQVEVEEISWIPMENGKKYTGDLFIKKSENPNFNYPMGVNGIYGTITAAVADLNLRGVSGPVRFLLNDPTYTTGETYPITVDITSTDLPTATNTVTIKPNVGVTSSISGASTSSIFKLNGADYIIIDGSNAVSGTTKDLTITNTAITSGSAVMWIASKGTGAGATYNTIKNCVLNGGANTSGIYNVFLGGATLPSSGADNDYNTIQNNTVTKAYYGIDIYGSSTATSNNLNINSNSIGSSTAGSEIKFAGIYVTDAVGSSYNNNTIFNITQTSSFDAFYVGTGVSNSTFNSNVIKDIINNGTNRATAFQIVTGTGSNNTFSNNIIYNVINNGTGGNAFGCYGFYVISGTGINLYYNSINMYGDRDAVSATKPSTISSAIYIGGGSTFDIRNNIFVNTQTAATNVPKSYSIYSAVANTVFSQINYNDYYVSGAQGVLGYLGADQATIAAWRTASGQDLNSDSGDPKFTSSTNLHIITTTPSPVNNTGTPIAGITTDYDGDSRSGSTPDIGADEYTYIAPSVEDPTVFAAANIHSTQLDLSWTNNGNNNDVMVVWNSSNTFAAPVDGNAYTVGGNVEGVGTVLYIGPDQFVNHSGLTYTTTYYYKAYSVDPSTNYSPGTAISKATTLPAVPVAFTSTTISGTQIDLSWTKNAATNDIIVATNSTNTFGTPSNGTTYNASDPLPTAGTVIYRGPAAGYNHTGLTSATAYYYKAWSVDAGVGYSATGLTSNASTLCDVQTLPFAESFDGATFIPSCWSLINAGSGNNWTRGTSTPYAGAGVMTYAYNTTYAANTWAFTPGFNLVNGKIYRVSFYQKVSSATYPEKLKVTIGSSPSVAGQTTTLWDNAGGTNLTNTTYALRTADFSCTSNGAYYFAFNAYSDADMYNLFVDEISIVELSDMTYTSSTTTQNTNLLATNSTNQQIIGIQVVTTGATNPISITDFALNTTGTTAPSTDISNAKIFYTGTTGTFSATGQFGSTVASPNGTFNISGSQALAQGTNYFWLTYDIPIGATGGNNVDAECTQITIGSNYTPTITAPAGERQIVGPIAAGTYTVGLAAFNKATGKNLYEQTTTRKTNTEHSKKQLDRNENKDLIQKIDSKFETKENGIDKKSISELTSTSSFNFNSKVIEEKGNEETVTLLYENGKPYDGPLYFYPEKKTKNTTLKEEIKIDPRKDVSLKSGNTGKIDEQTDEPNGVYATITAALTDLNTRGISGPVIFELVDDSYASETFPLVISNVSGMNATNTFILRPASGKSPVISGSVNSGAVLKIYNTNYVTIDGSNNGSTSRNMSITNTSATTPNAVWIGSNGTTPITNITVKNCLITNGAQTSTAVVISDGATIGTAGYFSNITLQNNLIQKAYMGVYATGGTTPQNGANLNLINNSLNSTGTNSIAYIGLYMQGVNGANISGNEIGNFDQTADQDDAGMWLATGTKNATIEKNKIFTIGYSGVNGYGAHGIKISTAELSSNILVKNNIIYQLTGDGWDYTTVPGDNPIGIYLFTTQTGLSVLNNSINLYGSTLNASLAMSMGICLGTGTTADIRNNNIVNNLGMSGATGYGSTAIYAQTDNTQFTDINFNNYYVNPTGAGVKAIGKLSATTTATTLSTWVTATGKDAYSVNNNPGFTSNTDLTPNTADANSWVLSGNGTHLTAVTTDYAGTTRPEDEAAGAPDIGAYEFGVPSVEPNNFNIAVAGVGTTNLVINGRTMGSLYFSAVGTLTSVDVKFYTGKNPPGTSGYPTSQFMNAYYTITPNGGASGFTYDVTYNYSEPQRGTIANENDIRLAKSDNNGTNWISYTSQGTGPNMYELFTVTNIIKVYGLTAFSTFTNSDVNAPLPVQLSSFNASLKGRDVTLAWKTESEINNAGFDVERKQDGTTEWKKAGFVAGKGTTNSPVNYTFEDKKLNSGKYNYRLKQIDNNGNFKYHNLTTIVDVALPTKFNLSQNYPNPFNPTTKIDFDLPFDSKVSIMLYDMTGREIKTLVNEARTAGYHTVQFNASELSSGTYFYRIITKSADKDFVATKKMVLVK